MGIDTRRHGPVPQVGTVSRHSGRPRPRGDRPVLTPFLVLTFLTLVTQLASVMFLPGARSGETPLLSVFLLSVAVLCVMTIPTAALGLLAGRRIGLGAPLLTEILGKGPGAGARLRQDATVAVPIGLGIGAFLLLFRAVASPYLPATLPAFGFRGPVSGLVLSVAAAVGEEVWLRLGIMSILAWGLTEAFRRPELTPAIAWTANALAAIGFGLIHLPQLAAAGAATPIGIVATMFGNGAVGIACGWLYWRRSLIAAMLAHFSVDLVLHVLSAL